MTINAVLLVATLAWFALLVGVEAYTAARGIPTISERIQSANRHAPLIAVIACTLLAMLAMHFFGGA